MSKVILDFNKNLVDLDGENLKDEKQKPIFLNKVLASSLMNSSATDLVVKYFDWAMDLNKVGKLELDNADKDTLTEFVKGAGLTVLFKGQLLAIINNPDKPEKTKKP